jgi:hypothetical protein
MGMVRVIDVVLTKDYSSLYPERPALWEESAADGQQYQLVIGSKEGDRIAFASPFLPNKLNDEVMMMFDLCSSSCCSLFLCYFPVLALCCCWRAAW